MATILKKAIKKGSGYSAQRTQYGATEQMVLQVYMGEFTSDPDTEKELFLFEARNCLIDADYVPGISFSSAYPTFRLNTITIQAAGVGCVANITYLTRAANIPAGGIALIEQTTVETTVTTTFVPGTRIPIQMSLVDSAKPQSNIQTSTSYMTYIASIRVINVTRLLEGDPDDVDATFADVEDTVNDAAWRGQPTGYWRLAKLSAVYANEPGWITVNIQAAKSPGGQDWSQMLRLSQPNSSKLAELDPTFCATLAAKDYARGYVGSDIADYDKKGVVRVGPYDLRNFPTIFGF